MTDIILRENVPALLVAFARLAFCWYRAVHQAIIVDEATTWNRFASGLWLKLFGRYDANNHILSSLLIKWSVKIGGLSPLTVRLPSLLAGFALTLGVFWLLKRTQSRTIRWTAFALVILHPLLMDFSIAARGYSISLALFAWGLYFCLENRYWIAGPLLGLSIAANLAIVVPIIAILIFRRSIILIFLVVLVGGGIDYPSLRRAHKDDFYIGYPELRTAIASFTFTSLHVKPNDPGILGDQLSSEKIGVIGLPIFLLLTAFISWRNPFWLLLFVTTLFGLILARWLFKLNYPADRTCLYFMILGALLWAAAGDLLKNRYARILWLVPAIILLIQFATQLQASYFQYWINQSDDQIIAQTIAALCQGKPDNSMAVSASWIHQPSLEFYRRALRIQALKPVERLEPAPLHGFDFYVLSGGDIHRAKQTALKRIFSDENRDVELDIE